MVHGRGHGPKNSMALRMITSSSNNLKASVKSKPIHAVGQYGKLPQSLLIGIFLMKGIQFHMLLQLHVCKKKGEK